MTRNIFKIYNFIFEITIYSVPTLDYPRADYPLSSAESSTYTYMYTKKYTYIVSFHYKSL